MFPTIRCGWDASADNGGGEMRKIADRSACSEIRYGLEGRNHVKPSNGVDQSRLMVAEGRIQPLFHL